MAVYFYNKIITKKKGKVLSTRIINYLIAVDLIVNILLGIVFTAFRNTFLGICFASCPIFLSPFLFIIQLIGVYIYNEHGKTLNA